MDEALHKKLGLRMAQKRSGGPFRNLIRAPRRARGRSTAHHHDVAGDQRVCIA